MKLRAFLEAIDKMVEMKAITYDHEVLIVDGSRVIHPAKGVIAPALGVKDEVRERVGLMIAFGEYLIEKPEQDITKEKVPEPEQLPFTDIIEP